MKTETRASLQELLRDHQKFEQLESLHVVLWKFTPDKTIDFMHYKNLKELHISPKLDYQMHKSFLSNNFKFANKLKSFTLQEAIYDIELQDALEFVDNIDA